MSNSIFINSVQPVAVTIAATNTTGTATLGTAVGSGAFVVWQGSNSQDATGAWKYSDASLTLTNSTTVTATRAIATSTTSTAYGVIIDGTSNLVSSVQFGTVSTAAGGTTGTATISSVNTSTSAVFLLGWSVNTSAGGTVNKIDPYVTLTNATTVTGTINTLNASSVNISFCVVTFNSAAIKSLQQFTTTSAVSSTTDTQAISSVVPSNAFIAYGGTSNTSTSPASGFWYGNLASATSVVFTTNTAAAFSRTHAYTVVEFVAGVITAQRGTVAISSGSNTATTTITSVDTTVSAANFLGFNTNQTTFEGATCYTNAVLTNATTVTSGINTAGSTNVAGFEVITFKGSAITESGNAVDTVSESYVGAGAISESGNAVDSVGLGPSTYHVTVTEAGYALDSVNFISAGTVITQPSTVQTGIGTAVDMLGRILNNLPARWFPAFSSGTPPLVATPILAAWMTGPATALAWVYSQIQYVRAQTRIATATNFNLDIISTDFFGSALPRRPGESDSSFSSRIRANLFLPHGTRNAIINALYVLTGAKPSIVEPGNATDCGGYATITTPTVYYGRAYAYAGAYGSMTTPAQFFVTARRSQQSVNPVAGVNGYAGYLSGYASLSNYSTVNYGSGEYVLGTVNAGSATDADIYNTVHQNITGGTLAWVRITN